MNSAIAIACAFMVSHGSIGAKAPKAPHANALANGESLDLAGIWLFHQGDSASFAATRLDDGDWTPMHLPTLTGTRRNLWQGSGWYRRHLLLTAADINQDLMFSLGPAREAVQIYVNGVLLAERGRFGSRPRGEPRIVPLLAQVPPDLLQVGDNILAVRLMDPTLSGGLPAGPLLLGSPSDVRQRTLPPAYAAMALRLALIAMLLSVAAGEAWSYAKPRRWFAAAALSLRTGRQVLAAPAVLGSLLSKMLLVSMAHMAAMVLLLPMARRCLEPKAPEHMYVRSFSSGSDHAMTVC